MGIDLALILSVYGGVFNGAILGWSIAGKEFTGIRSVLLYYCVVCNGITDDEQWFS